MASITIRDIPEELLKRIRTLSTLAKRSLNSQILVTIEQGLLTESRRWAEQDAPIGKATQLSIWEELAGEWEDTRTTDEIVADIYEHRTVGRNVDL